MDPTPISELTVSARIRWCLGQYEITTLGKLDEIDDQTLLRIPNFGRKSLAELRAAVDAHRRYQNPLPINLDRMAEQGRQAASLLYRAGDLLNEACDMLEQMEKRQ